MTPTSDLRPMLSGPMLTRVGGVPVDVLDIVAAPTRSLLAELAGIATRLEELTQPLIDTFFALVPRLDDEVDLRRQVLAGKRALHKLNALPWAQETIDRVAARLGRDEGLLLHTWVRLTRVRSMALAELETRLGQDEAAAFGILRSALDEPGVMESMAIAASDWVRHADLGATTPRNIKTLYSYVSRAAVKTSPFSGLTTVGAAGTKGEGRAASRGAVALAMLAVQRLARDERTAALLRYRAAPVRDGGTEAPHGLLLHGETVIAGGVVWRQDRVMEADHASAWLAGLGEGDLTLEQVLNHVGGSDPFARFRRLLDAGVLTIVVPWRQNEAPLEELATLVSAAPSAPISAERLEAAHLLGERAHRASVKDRLAALEELGRHARSWSDPERGRPAPATLLYEDRETGLNLPDVSGIEPVREDLRALGALTRPYIFRSHIYDLLAERFVAAYGPGGTCDDPLGFLMRLSVDRDTNPPLNAAMAADRASSADPGERAWLPVGPTSAPPGTTVLFQTQAATPEQVERGDYQMVINQFSTGSGALFTRFARLLGQDFGGRLREHITRSRPGVACREVVVWADCNTAQADCAGLLPPLVLPGEPTRADAITLDDTLLVHDRDTGTLSLTDRGGEPIGLAYLGLLPQHQLQSYTRLLMTLADPWVNASPHADGMMNVLPELLPQCHPGRVVALPRVTHGRVVTRRASWLAPVTELPLPRAGESEAELAVRVDAFRRDHAMPEEVFVQQVSRLGLFASDARKPLWVSLASPLSVRVLRTFLDEGTAYVRIVEALPARDGQPLTDDQGRRRVTEHAAMLVWPKES